MSKKHIIWSSLDLDIDDWRDAYAEYLEINDIDDDPDDEDAIYNFMIDTNTDYLDDERINLNKRIDGRILVIADLGLWDGRHQGYRIINDHNLNAFLKTSCDEFYGDGKDIQGTEIHHDGTNHYTFRMIREDHEQSLYKLLDAIYNGKTISAQKLNYYTKSLYDEVANVYGWR